MKNGSRLLVAPYSDSQVVEFYRKALDQYSERAIEQAIFTPDARQNLGYYRAIPADLLPAHHPLMRFLDDLAAYLVKYPDALVAHNNQALVKRLFGIIYTKLDAYYSMPVSDRAGTALAGFISNLRADIWGAVKHLHKGEVYTAALLFLARTSFVSSATDYVLPSDKEDFKIQEVDASAASARKIKACFVKANQAALQNPAGAEVFLIWLSNFFMRLFGRAQEVPAARRTTPPPVAAGASRVPVGSLTVDTGAGRSAGTFTEDALAGVEQVRRARRRAASHDGSLFATTSPHAAESGDGSPVVGSVPALGP